MANLPQVQASGSQPDFTGLWQAASGELVVKPDDDKANLTEEAKARIAHYERYYDVQKEDAVQFCVPHGMPWIMTSREPDYLIDIYQTPERITMLFEGMDVYRIIHMNEQGPPETFMPAPNGYSIGRWEGDTLVIETTALSARNPVGYKQRSDQARILERWRLIDHPEFGKALEIELTVEDPVVYRRPARGYQLLVQAPEGSTLNEYGCTQSAWEDYVRNRKQALGFD